MFASVLLAVIRFDAVMHRCMLLSGETASAFQFRVLSCDGLCVLL